MSAAPFDTLALARALRDEAKFTSEQAEGTARALASAFVPEIATKADVAASRNELKADIAVVRNELKADIAALRSDLEIMKRDITIQLGGMLVVSVGVLLTAKFFG